MRNIAVQRFNPSDRNQTLKSNQIDIPEEFSCKKIHCVKLLFTPDRD